ncbi:MAG: sensor histidine kinase, partial [Myxococcales bacterium]
TERKRNEEELRGALAFRDQILNVLAHDLRQPLSVIGGSASILLRKEGLEQHAAVFLRQIRNVERMDRMIRDLLDYARARGGSGMPIHRQRVDLADLVRQASESIQTLHPDREIRIDIHGSCTGQFDPDRMLQVFGNLLGNAAAYSPKSTPIEVALRCETAAIVCRIHNLGAPIPPERIASVFEPFRRGTSSANPQGLGLGLFIVEQIVTAHGGKVEVASTPEAGTTFTLRLPR